MQDSRFSEWRYFLPSFSNPKFYKPTFSDFEFAGCFLKLFRIWFQMSQQVIYLLEEEVSCWPFYFICVETQ